VAGKAVTKKKTITEDWRKTEKNLNKKIQVSEIGMENTGLLNSNSAQGSFSAQNCVLR
jgi:hypothetical protein